MKIPDQNELSSVIRSSTGSVFQHQMEITEPSKTGQPTHVIQIQDLKRLENWILALKLRYWIDFGQRKQYNVEWVRKLDSSGDLVEIVIKVDQHKDADYDTSNCQSQS